MPITLEELEIKFKAEMGNVNQQLAGVRKELAGVEQSAGKAGGAFAFLKKAGVAAAAAMVGRKFLQVGKDALDMANDVVESEQLFEVSMGRMEAKAREWSDSVGSALGLNAYELRKSVGMFNTMFLSMGATEDQAYDMSTGLTQLANDMASFYNLDPSEAFNKLKSGITGQTEPLRALGILVDEETVKQYALENGISKTGKAMTQSQKLQARYGAIMKQTMKAQGDLARTLDSPANQLRRLNAEFEQTKIALGQALQPALVAIMPTLTNFAAGMTRILKGDSDPLSGTMLSLASATEAIKSRVDTTILQVAAEVARLSEATETAVGEFISTAQRTRELYLNITLKPQNSVLDRVPKIFNELRGKVDEAALTAFQSDITAVMKVAIEDGTVTEDERKKAIALIESKAEELRKMAKEKLTAIQIDTAARLNLEEISINEHDDILQQAQNEYDSTIGMIDSLSAEAIAELKIANWIVQSLSVNDRSRMIAAMNEMMAKQEAVALQARATVKVLFDGTGGIGAAVDSVYADAIAALQGKRQEISDLMNESIDADWDWIKINRLRQEMAEIIQFITEGITDKGKWEKALFDLREISPETVKSFADGYTKTLKELTKAEQDSLEAREKALFTLKAAGDKAGLEKALEKYGYTDFETAVKDLRGQSAAAKAGIQASLLKSAADAIIPQLLVQAAKATTPADLGSISDIIMSMLSVVDYSAINEESKAVVERYADVLGRLDLGSVGALRLGSIEGGLNSLLMMFDSNQMTDAAKGAYDAIYAALETIKGYQKEVQEPFSLKSPGAFGGYQKTETLVIDRPKLDFRAPMLEIIGRSFLAEPKINVLVEIAPTSINTNLYVDDLNLGRATTYAQQTVARLSGGGGAGLSSPMLVRDL